MTKYLLLYNSPVSAEDQMANASPEEGAAGMEAWNAWAGRAGSAIVDFGAPVQAAGTVGASGGTVGGDRVHVGGYSILEADNAEALRGLIEDHPHLALDSASIEYFEFLELPGAP